MKKIIIAAIAAVACGAASAGEANRLILTSAAGKAGQMVSIEFLSGGDVAGFNARIRLPEALSEKSSVDLSACTQSLPKGFSASCSIKEGELSIAAFDASGSATLASGVHAVGTVRLPAGSLTVTKVVVSDNAGQSQPVGTEVN